MTDWWYHGRFEVGDVVQLTVNIQADNLSVRKKNRVYFCPMKGASGTVVQVDETKGLASNVSHYSYDILLDNLDIVRSVPEYLLEYKVEGETR